MDIKTTFSVIARCRKRNMLDDRDKFIKISNKNIGDYTVEDIELTFDINSARKLLFKFTGRYLLLGEYNIIMNQEDNNNYISIVDKDHNLYLVTNVNQLLNEVIAGYDNLVVLNKMIDILNYDYSTLDNNNNVEDEFCDK
jgi:hypothetical protein